MRIPDFQNFQGVKGKDHRTTKTGRVNKTHEDEFENELEDCINEKNLKQK